jgi:hypothetical protein
VSRALLYFFLAIALGLLTILVPLMAFAGLHGGDGVFKADSLLRGLRGLEGSYAVRTGASGSEVDVFLISLMVASIVYLLFRRRIPEQDRQWTKF